MIEKPLLTFLNSYVVGSFLRRHKRFSVAVQLEGKEVWIHSNNSGSMLGLLRQGLPVLLSPATNPARKLAFTQEAVWLPANNVAVWLPANNAAVWLPMNNDASRPASGMQDCESQPIFYDTFTEKQGFWVGVNTSIPNKLLQAAFEAKLLPFAQGYTELKREAKRGKSRLDACLQGAGLPPLWIECKNVTMVEDDVACFPDAATERGQKHLQELMDIVKQGERAAMFYLVQRADGQCFGPAAVIDPVYAELFWEAVHMGVEVYPYRAKLTSKGVFLGELLPLQQCNFMA